MDLWEKAKVFAEEAAKRSQEISMEAAKKSQGLTKGAAKFQEFVSETAKKSKELAVEAGKKADQIKIPGSIQPLVKGLPLPVAEAAVQSSDLERYGITEELREFVKGITLSTFRDFPMEDEPEMSEVPTVSNVRQDLSEWQAKHATLVLTTVKEISKFRYELCPRYMKERKFWRIYFVLVSSHVSPYEKQFMEESREKAAQQEQESKPKESGTGQPAYTPAEKEAKSKGKASTSDHDLDIFLLGDGSSDEAPDDGDDALDDDDDLDKIDDNPFVRILEPDEKLYALRLRRSR
ncbi:unnamed protein product [Spirodela intermedia]|uniref:BSD domain-containing protein n=1 Tax=Spirodela intermedia TaxID=51605 RepID=A0A7I8JKI1_SPIIN|nr:unnamed protein product [Spirodela intermedia]CAA6670687.1 unnamed protein product [Spirodela intermedia]